jgi:hypothetical protein
MNIVVNEELKAYIDPLTPEEHEALERSLLAEGCRDALVLWGDVLVDGHNRYGICRKHGLPFQTVQNPRFKSIEDVHLWMIDQHLGRRSVSNFQRGLLALRKSEILAERRLRAPAEPADAAEIADVAPGEAAAASVPSLPPAAPLNSRESIAKAARLSSSQVQMIETIQKQAAPELVAAVRSGEISINAAAVVATLPMQEQAAAAAAGKDELRQVAKRVREAKRRPREAAAEPVVGTGEAVGADESIDSLRARVAALSAENQALRQQIAALQASAAAATT